MSKTSNMTSLMILIKQISDQLDGQTDLLKKLVEQKEQPKTFGFQSLNHSPLSIPDPVEETSDLDSEASDHLSLPLLESDTESTNSEKSVNSHDESEASLLVNIKTVCCECNYYVTSGYCFHMEQIGDKIFQKENCSVDEKYFLKWVDLVQLKKVNRVKSQSNEIMWYYVMNDGTDCSCPARRYNPTKVCKHMQLVGGSEVEDEDEDEMEMEMEKEPNLEVEKEETTFSEDETCDCNTFEVEIDGVDYTFDMVKGTCSCNDSQTNPDNRCKHIEAILESEDLIEGDNKIVSKFLKLCKEKFNNTEKFISSSPAPSESSISSSTSVGSMKIEVPSMTDPSKWYTVNLAYATCTCPHFKYNTPIVCKHMQAVLNEPEEYEVTPGSKEYKHFMAMCEKMN